VRQKLSLLMLNVINVQNLQELKMKAKNVDQIYVKRDIS
jgi:hypothetical protein